LDVSIGLVGSVLAGRGRSRLQSGLRSLALTARNAIVGEVEVIAMRAHPIIRMLATRRGRFGNNALIQHFLHLLYAVLALISTTLATGGS